MGRDVLVTFLKSVIFLDIMEIVSSDDYGAFHLDTLDYSSQDSTTNTYITSERTLLVNVRAFNGLYDKGGSKSGGNQSGLQYDTL